MQYCISLPVSKCPQHMVNNNPAIASRDEVADIAKGIGIIFVVAGHCEFDLPDFLAFSFHMPLFFFISGFFISSFINNPAVSAWSFLRRRFIRLMLPFYAYILFFGIISWLSQFCGLRITEGSFASVMSLHNLFIEPFLSNHQFPIACALWFVPALFCAFIFVAIARPVLSLYKNYFILALILLFLVILYYLCASVNNYLPYNYRFLARNIIGFIYVVMGFVYYNTPLKRIDARISLIIGLAAYYIISFKLGHIHFSMFNNDYGSYISRCASLPTALAGIAIIMSLSRLIAGNQSFINKKGFMALGMGSYHIMAVHLSFFVILNIMISLLFNQSLSNINTPYYRFTRCIPLYFIFSLAGSYWYLKTIEKIREYPWNALVGFWAKDPN